MWKQLKKIAARSGADFTIDIPDDWKDRLLNMEESGMGYQTVDINLKNGKKIRGLTIINGNVLAVPEEYNIKTEDLDSFELSNKWYVNSYVPVHADGAFQRGRVLSSLEFNSREEAETERARLDISLPEQFHSVERFNAKEV